MSKKKLFLGLMTVVALVIIVLGYVLSVFVEKRIVSNLLDQYVANEQLVAAQVAQKIEVEIAQTQSKLNLIALIPDVISGSTEACNSKLKYIYGNPDTKIGNLGRVYPDGTFHCSLNAKLIGVKADTLGKYIDTIFNDPKHSAVMSRAILPPGSPSYVVAIHVPVWNADKTFDGTLGGAVYLNDLEKNYLATTTLPKGSSIVVIDDDGTILFHFQKDLIGKNYASPEYQKLIKNGVPPEQLLAEIKSGTSGSRHFVFNGEERISAFVPVHIFPGRNWRISLTVPIETAYDSIAPVQASQLLQSLWLTTAVLVVFLFSLITYLFMNQIFAPIGVLIQSAERIGKGEEVLIPNVGNDEMGALATAFNSMSKKIKESSAVMELRVHERTKQLEERSKELERTNALMVGRELKMRELKEEIAKLKDNGTTAA